MREMFRFGLPMGLLAFVAMAVASAPSAANDTAVLDLKPTVIEDALPSTPAASPVDKDNRSGPADPVVEQREQDPDAGQMAKAVEPTDKPTEAERTDGQAQTAQDQAPGQGTPDHGTPGRPTPGPALADTASNLPSVDDIDIGSRGAEKLPGVPPSGNPPVTAPTVVAAPAPAAPTTTAPAAPLRTEPDTSAEVSPAAAVPAPAASTSAEPKSAVAAPAAQTDPAPAAIAEPTTPTPVAPTPAVPTVSAAKSPEAPLPPAQTAGSAAPAAPTKTVEAPAAKAPAAKTAAAGQGPRPPMNRLRLEPIQSANPDRNIVVCVGGCGGKRVVLNEPKPTTPVRTPAGAELTPAAKSKVPVDKIARCAGGCYPFTSGFTHAGGYTQPEFGSGRVVAVENANWLTNSPAPTPQITRPARQITPPAPVKAKRDDWMARINRDREAERAARGQPGAPAL